MKREPVFEGKYKSIGIGSNSPQCVERGKELQNPFSKIMIIISFQIKWTLIGSHNKHYVGDILFYNVSDTQAISSKESAYDETSLGDREEEL